MLRRCVRFGFACQPLGLLAAVLFCGLAPAIAGGAAQGAAADPQIQNQAKNAAPAATDRSPPKDAPPSASPAKPADPRKALSAEMHRHEKRSNELSAAGKFTEAAQEADAALVISRQVNKDVPASLVLWIDFAAAAHESATDFPAARTLRQETLDLQQSRLGKLDWQVTNARLALDAVDRMSRFSPAERSRLAEAEKQRTDSITFFNQHKSAEAIAAAEKSFDIYKELFGEDNYRTAAAANRLGFLYNAGGDYVQARVWNQKAADVRKQTLGDQHPDFAVSLNNLAWSYYYVDDYAHAEPIFRQIVQIREAAFGEKHADTVQALTGLMDVLEKITEKEEAAGDITAAIRRRQELVDIKTKIFGATHYRVAEARLALTHVERLSKVSADDRRRLAEADRLQALATTLSGRKKQSEAIALAKKAYDLRKSILGEDDPLTINSTHWLGYLYNAAGMYAEAETWNKRAVDLRLRLLGPHHPDCALSIDNLAYNYYSRGNYAGAEPLFRQSLEIRRSALGEKNSDTIQSYNGLSDALEQLAAKNEASENFKTARAQRAEVLAIKTKLLGAANWHVTDARIALNHVVRLSQLSAEDRRRLADADSSQATLPVLSTQGKYTEAIELAKEAYETRKQILGDQNSFTAASADWLGRLYDSSGDYAQSERWKKLSIEIQRRQLGEHHPTFATALSYLARLYADMGAYTKAEPLDQQALAIRKETLGENSRDYSMSLNDLAILYDRMGDYARAEPLYREATRITKEILGMKHYDYATSLSNLAALYLKMGESDKALPLYQEASAIDKEVLGESHPFFALDLQSLAEVYRDSGKYSQALPLFQQALAIQREALGEKHPRYLATLEDLALLDKDMGKYDEAEAFFQQVIATRKSVLGEQHRDYAASIYDLARLYETMGKYDKAEPLAAQALQIVRNQLDATACIQSERQQLRMAETARHYLNTYLSVTAGAKTPAATVYAQVLSWKGSVSARQQIMRRMRQGAPVHGSLKTAKLFDQLAAASRDLSNQSLAIPAAGQEKAHQRQIALLSDQIESLQQQLAAENHEFRDQLDQQRRTPDDIRHALPPDAALVDLLEYTRYVRAAPDAKEQHANFTRSLVGFVVRADRPIERIELGPVAPIAGAIAAWRKDYGLHDAAASDGPAQELRGLVWDKLDASLTGEKTILFSPDGATARFPWPALPGKQPGTYLIEDVAIAVVPIPRLLPELLAAKPSPAASAAPSDHGSSTHESTVQPPVKSTVQPPVEAASGGGAGDVEPSLLLIGDVNFDADPGRPLGAVAESPPRGTRSGRPLHWPALPGTRTEIVSIADSFEQQFPDAKLKKLRDANATKTEVVALLDRYSYVHFATHGFFAPTEYKSALAAASRGSSPGAINPFSVQDVSGFQPGLLSGLVLAGANLPDRDGKDDGILTALEVSDLDLSHVELATLSACETGLGETAGGEGLLGLQRAFQISGAKSVMATLWTIRDDASRTLMIDFYENLWKRKMSKIEALRQAQLTMLREGLKRGLELPDDQPADKQHRLPPYYWAAFVLSGDWR